MSDKLIVELFQLEAYQYGLGPFYFSSSANNDKKIVFAGNIYEPLPIEAGGFEWSGNGPPPRPHITLSSINEEVRSLFADNHDLLGAKVTRIRTFASYLGDGGADRFISKDIYTVERKASLTPTEIELELISMIDNESLKLPRRQIFKSICHHRYRVYAGNRFDYSQATCPYVGNKFFSKNNQPSDEKNDQCAHTLFACSLRHDEVLGSASAPLPFGGFPGVLDL